MNEVVVTDERPGHKMRQYQGVRPVSEGSTRPGDSDKRKSAAADLAHFRSETSPGHHQLQPDQTSSSTRSSSVMQDSSSSQPRHRSQSRNSRMSSARNSSRLDTTGSSDVLDSSYEDHSRASNNRSSYYYGEAPELKDILAANVNGNVCDNNTNNRGVISPHTGEVVRIKVPFRSEENSNNGQSHSAENIQRITDQQISPVYNGHKVTIKVNRSNEALTPHSKSQVSVKKIFQTILGKYFDVLQTKYFNLFF